MNGPISSAWDLRDSERMTCPQTRARPAPCGIDLPPARPFGWQGLDPSRLGDNRRGDLVALGRAHLIDPHWTLRATAAQDYRGQWVPPQYLNGMAQLARTLAREAELRAARLRA